MAEPLRVQDANEMKIQDAQFMGEEVKVVDLPKSAWLRVREWAGEHGRYQRACLAEAVNEWADRQVKRGSNV